MDGSSLKPSSSALIKPSTRWKLAAKSLWPGKIERRPREGFGVGGTTAIASTAQQCGKTCETPLRAGLDIESNMDLQGQVSYKWTIMNHLTISNHFWETKRVWVSVSICLKCFGGSGDGVTERATGGSAANKPRIKITPSTVLKRTSYFTGPSVLFPLFQ